MTLPTIIAELEEAERAATPGPWSRQSGCEPRIIVGPNSRQIARCYLDATTGQDAIANARLIALMRTHLPTLIEAVKRQREALNHIVSIGEAHGSNYDFERILDMRDIARAALTAHKEKSDV